MKPNSKPTKLTYQQIKEQLEEKDILLSDIADVLGVSRSHAYQTAKGQSRSKRVAEAIAKCLDLKISDVFGNDYENVQARSKSCRDKRRSELAKVIGLDEATTFGNVHAS
jgi:DNA-binding XRE family transcriptional regulator